MHIVPRDKAEEGIHFHHKHSQLDNLNILLLHRVNTVLAENMGLLLLEVFDRSTLVDT